MTEEQFVELKHNLGKLKVIPKETTFLDVIDKLYDENIISNWISFIFNPTLNGVGNKPVEELLNSVSYKSNEDLGDFIDILREDSTDNRKRMDLVIKYSNIWIVIENKIRTTEHNNQTEKYYNYIEKERKKQKINNVVYIYLRPDWNEPGNLNVPSKKYNKGKNENGFRNLFYSNLIDGLKEINDSDYKEPKKFIYLKEFIEIAEMYYVGKEFKITKEVELYMNYMPQIKEIQEQYINLKNSVLSRLETLLQNQFKDYYINNSSIHSTYYQIADQSWNKGEKTRTGIHYEILSKDFFDIVGNNNVHIQYYIHLEDGVKLEKREKIFEKIQNYGSIKHIEKKSKKLWLLLDDCYYNFKNEEEIEKSMKEIVDKMVQIDKKWKKEIESWKDI